MIPWVDRYVALNGASLLKGADLSQNSTLAAGNYFIPTAEGNIHPM